MARVLPRIELTPEEEAGLRERVLRFIERYRAPKIVITTGLDGRPRFRLMGVRMAGFTPYLVSIKPSAKLAELQANPEVTVLWYQYDADDAESDQPLRLVAITGEAELVLSPVGIRAFPGPDQPMSDDELARTRFGVIVHPTKIRVEGFFPGPRYPVFLRP
ncbi:MAG: pyridoxamine 5'-phosphate oxidase family protein [Chloroflexota bacterium]|nr:pyridoxamine 5'-phosphate oxidase family protein [Dehalococcoidia bacterium]MDW8255127.1 pyridoxamine 5'-phosphate oxidase family protein [Chloroflexota bacterium]